MSRACEHCGRRTLVPDDESGNMVCASCGTIQEFDNFQAHIGGITGVTGTYVRLGTAGTGTFHNYKETKIYHAQNVINDFMFKLGFSVPKSEEVRLLIEKVTDGEYGQGEWFPVLVGACSYIVMRKDQKMLPIVEVADTVGCDVYELGRMIGRVVDFVDMKLPEFDIVNAFERAMKTIPSFGGVQEDLVERMLQQGVFLVQCLIKWFVTTGRRPMPVVAAVLVFVAQLNQVDNVKIEDVAMELHVVTSTCRRRYKELLERLVEVAQVLPWGKDVTVKNILRNAPSVMQYMEMKSCSRGGGKQSIEQSFDVEGLVGDCLIKEIGYGYHSYNMEEGEDCSSSKYFELPSSASDYPDKFQISHECLTLIYSNCLEGLSAIDVVNPRKRRGTLDLQRYSDWWSGKSEMSKKLILKEVLAKDVGLDARPPAFDRACLSSAKRREKIEAAKLRILRIIHPRTDVAVVEAEKCNDLALVEPRKKTRKRKRKCGVDMEWEDLIIETLLLHNVKEEEIEKGHYNALLDLHVFAHDNE
ncbi:LOW QUALITY PROTEIN: plant-specific TFIIB-related protein PTF2 [Salvia miltiorrhiza]|uniref:LOW QUALITY PROTEIN: plant-specific TFIIB-related protein PTF2 n=1 Tax=Salvia miltiorrhiza TaxID=226208 RepID=UPI0025AB9D4D|nr:LOW QUALITY PROTEIN: plant-specific TFIIB-related protein PTF2 [Salvia miltiorrhiza]